MPSEILQDRRFGRYVPIIGWARSYQRKWLRDDLVSGVVAAATMAGAMVATIKAPIFSALFVSVMVQREAAAVIAIAVIVGLLATARLSMTPAQPEGGPGVGKAQA